MLRLSDNHRYLVQNDGTPFFYLADTAWALFHNIDLTGAFHYLQVRADQGFSVIMPVCIWGDDLTVDRGSPNRVFYDHDLRRPVETFWANVEAIVERCNALGMTMAILPSWGHYVEPAREGWPEIVTLENARDYGRFLGQRYGDKDVIWVLGGDRYPPKDDDTYLDVWPEMAAGLDEGQGYSEVKSWHPTSVYSSSQWYPDAPWLDFHMWQTSTRIQVDYCETLLTDYVRAPTKPFLDGETRYEHSHFRFWGQRPKYGVRMTPKRVRQAAYYAMLCGAMGHTYGCRDVWSFHVPSEIKPDRDIDTHWREALHFPAAEQLRYWRALFERYPWFNLVPDIDNSLVTLGSMEGNQRIQGALANDGTFALIYIPDDMPVVVDLDKLSGSAVDATWFDPVTGKTQFAQRYTAKGSQFLYWAGNPGEQDHVLVLQAID